MKMSILMASYNCAKYIGEAIQSVIGQTHDNWEIIVVDDGSKDNTKGVVDKFLNDKINYYRQENGGYASALRSAVDLAVGDVYGILDSDDCLQTDAIESVIGEFTESVGCVYSTYKLYSEDWSCEFFRPNNEMPCEGFDLNIKASVDKDIIYKLEEHTDLKFINKCLYKQRIRDDNMTMSNIRNDVSKHWTMKVRSNAIFRRIKNRRFDLLDNSVLLYK